MKLFTKHPYLLAITVAGLIGGPLAVQAAEEDDDDVTMTVLEEGELPDRVFERIELPEVAAPEAVEASAFGLDTANQAREERGEFGQSVAEEARQRGADEARERFREDVARGNLDNLPQQVRDNIPDEVRERRGRRGPPGDGG